MISKCSACQTHGTELAMISKKKNAKGKAKSQTLASSSSLEKEQVKKSKGEVYPPQPPPMKARGSLISFQTESNGAAYAGRKGTEPKLAGGTAINSINSSTYSTKLGTDQISSSTRLHRSFKEEISNSCLQDRHTNLQQLDLRQTTRE